MGVSIYLLDRRRVTLLIDGFAAEIGTLRRSWKVTELDNERAGEIEKAKVDLQGRDAPLAVMVAELVELPLATAPDRLVQAHMVLGWDADRSSVTDHRWDHLPVLGYAVRLNTSPDYVFHELKAGQLCPCTRHRAIELGFLDGAGDLVRLGQPRIVACRSVEPYISFYALADCVLSDGTTVEILTSIETGSPPDKCWYLGKKPTNVSHYLPQELEP